MCVQAALREQPPIVMVVGNKSDRAEQRCVPIEGGRNLALVSTYLVLSPIVECMPHSCAGVASFVF